MAGKRITAAELDAELARCLADEPPPTEPRAHGKWVRQRSHDSLDRQLRAAVEVVLNQGVTTYDVAKQSGIDATSLRLWLRGEKASMNLSTASLVAEYLGLELRPKGESK